MLELQEAGEILLVHKSDVDAVWIWHSLGGSKLQVSYYNLVCCGDEATPTCGTCPLIRDGRTIELVALL